MPDFSLTNHLSRLALGRIHPFGPSRPTVGAPPWSNCASAPNCPLIFRPDCKLAIAPCRVSRRATGGIDFRWAEWHAGTKSMARWLRGIVGDDAGKPRRGKPDAAIWWDLADTNGMWWWGNRKLYQSFVVFINLYNLHQFLKSCFHKVLQLHNLGAVKMLR